MFHDADTLCRDKDPDLWFPEGKQTAAQIAEAKAVCAACPLQLRCREHALKNEIEYGIWGGLTEKERAELLKDKPAPAPEPKPKKDSAWSSEVRGVFWNYWRVRWEVIIHHQGVKHYGCTHRDKASAEAKALAMHEALGTSPERKPGKKAP